MTFSPSRMHRSPRSRTASPAPPSATPGVVFLVGPTPQLDVRFCLSGRLARLCSALVQEQLLVPRRGERSGRADRRGAPPGAAVDRDHRPRRRVRHRAGACAGRGTGHSPDRGLADHPAGQLGDHAAGDEPRRIRQPLPAGYQRAAAQHQGNMQRQLARGRRSRAGLDCAVGRRPQPAQPTDRRRRAPVRHAARSILGRFSLLPGHAIWCGCPSGRFAAFRRPCRRAAAFGHRGCGRTCGRSIRVQRRPRTANAR